MSTASIDWLAAPHDEPARSLAWSARYPGEALVAAIRHRQRDTHETWRQAKFFLANEIQRAEIRAHRESLSYRAGRIIAMDEAAIDWIRTHASAFRKHYEAEIARTLDTRPIPTR